MNLRDGYIDVKKALGEGPPWLFDDATVLIRLNRSARGLCSAAQYLRDTYAFSTAQRPDGTFYQEYAMPASCESVTSGKVQIGTLWPLDFSKTQAEIQTGGYVGGAPVMAYIRRGLTMTQQTTNSSETVFPVPGAKGKYAPWIIGLYPIPSAVYPVFIDYVAYHPEMKDPMDPCLLPDIPDIFDAWTAYGIYKGMSDQGDSVERDRFKMMYDAGEQACQQYVFAQQCQVTQPEWGGGSGPSGSQGLIVSVMAPTAANLMVD